MSANYVFTPCVAPIDPVVAFSYPATASVEIKQSGVGLKHYIDYAGAPSTLFANAPNGSVLFDNTNSDLYIKSGAIGSGIDGTWTKASP